MSSYVILSIFFSQFYLVLIKSAMDTLFLTLSLTIIFLLGETHVGTTH